MIQLRPYQQPHAAHLLGILNSRLSAFDGSDCGTGKTYAASYLAGELKRKTLVICPLSVVPTWEQILTDAGVPDFTVINYERAWRKLGRKVPWGKGSYFEWTDRWPMFIFDEVHRCQSATTMQGKMLIAATRQARLAGGKILDLSATAAATPLKLRAIGFSLGLHNLDNWYSWLDEHGCPELTLGPKEKPEKQWKERVFLKGKQDEVMAKLHHDLYPARGSRLRIADIPGFPTTQIDVRLLDGHDREVQRLSTELKQFYDNRRALAASLEKREDDDSVLARMTYARQAMEIAKVPALLDMIEDALETSRVAVFCNYSKTLDALAEGCAARKWRAGFIRGDQNAFTRKQVIDSFQIDNLDVALVNIQAGGVGVSLHSLRQTPRTSLICPTYKSDDLKQAFGRVRRDGGGPSIQHVVYFRNTVEEEVARSVQRKLANLDTLNDGDLDPCVVQSELAI